jgi:phosphoglycerate dehydrogenase-like enzyme
LKILVAIFGEVTAWTISDDGVARLRAGAPHVEIVHARTDEAVRDGIVDAEVAFSWRIDREALMRATRLRWIQTPAAGIGPTLLSETLRTSEIVLTNSRGVNAAAVAEHAFALTLGLARRLPAAMARQQARSWAQNDLTESSPRVLEGLTLGIIGLGTIGSAVARIGRGFGMRVVATRRQIDRPNRGVDALYPPERLATLLTESDVVVLAVPATRETAHLIGARELSLMRPDALLVNVGRGGLVDENALIHALSEGRLGGAGLDVFADEPLPASSPLWTLPTVMLTPHIAGVRPDYWAVAVDMFLDNLRRFEAGEPLVNVVDKEAGY